ncbi:MAG: hypothetical protein R3F19_18430 [Verrucomicrobiales bacterium]
MADKVWHMFNGGALVPEAATSAFMSRINQINLPIRAQSARWGDNQRATRPYTRVTMISSATVCSMIFSASAWIAFCPRSNRVAGFH